MCSKGGICDDELSFWDAGTGPGSLQFHSCLLSPCYGSPVCSTLGVWKKLHSQESGLTGERDTGGTAMSRVNKVVIKAAQSSREAH